ncbi:unnamed protein product, partial [Timema podura]|nr:unnamed protein product [Timema podura]
MTVSTCRTISGHSSGVYKDTSRRTERQDETRTKELCNECRNRGYCNKSQGKVFCECFERFYQGENCSTEVDHCGANPCSNGGTCHKMWGNYFCECSTGFHGLHCNVTGEDMITARYHVLIVSGEDMITARYHVLIVTGEDMITARYHVLIVTGTVSRIDTPVVLLNIQVQTGAETLHVFICGEKNCNSDDFELKITSGDGMEFTVLTQHLINKNNPYELLSRMGVFDTLLHHVTR